MKDTLCSWETLQIEGYPCPISLISAAGKLTSDILCCSCAMERVSFGIQPLFTCWTIHTKQPNQALTVDFPPATFGRKDVIAAILLISPWDALLAHNAHSGTPPCGTVRTPSCSSYAHVVQRNETSWTFHFCINAREWLSALLTFITRRWDEFRDNPCKTVTISNDGKQIRGKCQFSWVHHKDLLSDKIGENIIPKTVGRS